MKMMKLHKAMMGKPRLKIDARIDDFNDEEYEKQRVKDLQARKKTLKKHLSSLTPEQAHAQVKRSLEKELARCEMDLMQCEGEDATDTED